MRIQYLAFNLLTLAISVRALPHAAADNFAIKARDDGSNLVERGNCPPGQHEGSYGKCESCPDGKEWDGKKCVCPKGQHEGSYGKCESCPNGKEWDGKKCVCPKGQHEGSYGKCESCPDGKEWDGKKCQEKHDCGKEAYWDGPANQCCCNDHGKAFDTKYKSCSCPYGTVYDDKKKDCVKRGRYGW